MQGPPANAGQSSAAPAFARSAGIPLFHAAWLFAAGIVAASWHWFSAGALLLSLACAALCCVAAALRAQRTAWLALGALWVLLGAWCAQVEPHPAASPQLLALSNGLLRTMEGTVTAAGPVQGEPDEDDPTTDADQPTQRVDLRLDSVEAVDDAMDRQVPMTGIVRLTVRWPAGAHGAATPCGERIRVTAQLLPPQAYHDPGAWNSTDYLLGQGITATGSLKPDRVQDLGPTQPRPHACVFSTAQHAAAARILALPAAMRRLPRTLRISREDAIMLAAMVAGDRTFLTHSLRASFERTGSFHMLVVSGLHLGIVAGFILLLARTCGISRVPATIVTIALSAVYALFTGFATPVQRSFWMVALYLCARLFYRERSPLNAIGFAVLCLLATSPRSLFDSSFQMTLLAVVTIAGIAVPLLATSLHPRLRATGDLSLTAIDQKVSPPIAQFRVTLRMFAAEIAAATNRHIGWTVFPRAVRFALQCCEALVVTFVVEFAMALPMAIYFHRLTLLALPVNLFILPLLLLLMPAALITLLASLLSPAVALVPGAITAVLLHIGIGLVQMFGSLRWGDIRLATPGAIQIALFCGLLAFALWILRSRLPRRAVFAWTALLWAGIAAVVPRPLQHPRDALLVQALDVGQGDSLLLISPEGKTLLVDGGGFGGGPHGKALDFDIGEQVVSAALWDRGIRHIDVVALTHAHSDHMGGLPTVLRNFHPKELWVGNNPPGDAYDALLREAAALGVTVRSLRAGAGLTLGSVDVRVLAPSAAYAPGPDPANNDSLVLHAAYGNTSVLLEGDAEAPIENAMLAETGLESTLLKVGHHGSATSTTPEFLARVAPRWAVISCGARNRYGHPRPEVLEALGTAKVRTFSTDVNGAVCFRLDGVSASPLASCASAR
jgi:competence protein ComEC